ncbi:hypothetical protein CFC21_062575 [Triticum aestivum]|nr:putative cysteine proteinase inhibitor 7 [Aegilops tauschii subsp. strangulata]XP_044378073.1 putative cysteine proteinase inhibitor 7 [Triticum aestivum]KAF7054992.1 hypothetical protein CFC21_062575 [Triticum aestivum]
MRTSILLLLAALGAVSIIATPTALDGEWQPIKNVTDPHVQDLGSWAVAQHNKVSISRLRSAMVLSGEVQIVAGVEYRLDVQALQGDGKDAMYKAEVFEQGWPTNTTRNLISFE